MCVQPVKEANSFHELNILKEKGWYDKSLILNCQGVKHAGQFFISIWFLFSKTFVLFVITKVLEMKTLWTHSHLQKANNKENPK